MSTRTRGDVLVVDDEPTIREVVSRYLQRAGYDTRLAADGADAVAAVARRRPDLIVLDLMLPGMDGLEVMRRVRADTKDTAIILLTAKGEELDRISGLKLGADDYVTKPFSPGELVARVDAVLRRVDTVPAVEAPLVLGDGLVVDLSGRRVTVDGEEVALTVREFELLAFLARHPGQAFSRDQLMEHVWQYAFYTDTATVTVHIRRLRAKLEPGVSGDGYRWIETVWGVGYRLAP